MKRKISVIFIIVFIFLLLIVFTNKQSFSYTLEINNVENIYKLSNSDEMCDAVKEKDIFTINIHNYQGYSDAEINEMLNNIGIDSLESIGIKKLDDYNYQIMTPNNVCYNASYRDKFVSKVSKGMDYPPWVYIGRMTSSSVAYVDDVIVKKDGTLNGNYSFLRIINAKRKYGEESNKLTWSATRKPTEKIYLSVDLSENKKKLEKSDTNNDLRLSFSYGVKSGDINIGKYDSVAYYLYDNNNTNYGPYKFEYVNLEKVYYENSSKINIYNIISENLFKNIPKNTIINKIEIIPYEFLGLLGGELKLYDLSIDKYQNNYIPNKEYLSIAANDLQNYTDAENLIRHRIIDDRMTQGLVKWRGSDDDSRIMKVYYSSAQASAPIIFDSNIRYGFPYTTSKVTGSTLYSFLGQMTYDEEENLYEYHIPTTYKKKIKAMRGGDSGEIIQHYKGEEISGNLYVLNTKGEIDNLYPKYKEDLKYSDFNNPNIEFISNNDIYVYGHSCSTSVYIPIARQIPTMTYVSSYDHFYSGDVEMVNLNLTVKEVETALRCTGKLDSESFMTTDIFNRYFTNVIKLKYTEQEIYNAYALAIPGDTFSHPGHVRIVSGYSHVECVNDNKITNNYYEGFCDNHGGIDPKKSYIITTEGGTSFVNKGNVASNYNQHIKSYETGWSYILDSRYTDITDVDQIYCKKLQVDDPTLFNNLGCTKYNIETNFRPNFKYTFEELFGKILVDSDTGDIDEDISDEDFEEGDNNQNGSTIVGGLTCPSYLNNNTLSYQAGIYLPFRYKEVARVKDTSLIENTNIKLYLEKEYSNDEYLSFLLGNKKLKGTIISNYLIDGIRIDVNDEQHYIYPNMTHTFSLYRDLDDLLLEKLSNLDYSKPIHIKVSVKSGPELSAIKQSFGDTIDDEYYITILEVRSPQVNYYQGNATGTAGTTRFSKITECASGEICQLASYKNLTSNSFPHSDNGWSFAGYTTSIDGTNIDYTNGQTITYNSNEDLNLYVVGKRNFKFSSGISPTTNSGDITQYWNPYNTNYVTTINVPEATPIESWTFIGYRANNSASSTITIKNPGSYQPSSNSLTSFEFRAIYKRDVTVNFNSNGGTGSMDSITKVQYYNSGFGKNNQNNGANITNVSFVLPKNTFTKKGCIFKGWGENNSSSSTLPEGYEYTSLNPNVDNKSSTKTLYAIWENGKGKITYNSNNGNNQTTSQTITFNTDTKLNKNTFTRSGYTFKEWNTKADGTGSKLNNEQTINVTSNIVLYAIWEEDFDYEINKYTINNEYINRIKIGTTLDDFKKNIVINTKYWLYVNNMAINNKYLLFTGGKTRIYNGNTIYKEFTNVVSGDTNGDALINSADLLKIQLHLLKKNPLTNAYYLAADVNHDNTINSADLFRVRQHLLGKIVIE